MSGAPAEVWLRKGHEGRYHETHYDDEPEVVRYVRADLYEAALALAERRVEATLRRWPRILALALTGKPNPTVTWREFCEAQDQFEEAVQNHRKADYP